MTRDPLVTTTLSTLPLEHLERTNVKSLPVNRKAKGKYLLLRIVEAPIQARVVKAVVEDHLGKFVLFIASNYIDPDCTNLCFEDVLPVGTVFALKEPLATVLGGNLRLKCDCPSDVVVLGLRHKLHASICNINWANASPGNTTSVEPITGEDWKTKGNKLFVQKKYNSALDSYLMALKQSNSSKLNTIIHLNLVATYFALRHFESCLKYALIVLETEPMNSNALFRAAKSSFRLRNFEDAKMYFQRFLSLDKINLTAANEAKRYIKLIKKASDTQDILEMRRESSRKPGTPLDYPEWARHVKIVAIEGKGRGIVATRDIPVGTILVISKAVGASFSDLPDSDMDNNPILIARLAQTVLKNPGTFGKRVYELTSGEPSLDKNAPFCDVIMKEEAIADVDRIGKIISMNSFKLYDDDSNSLIGVGLFILPSYFNHSCIPNAAYETFNDMLVIHALQPIPSGEEITIGYTSTDPNYLTRKTNCMERHFECDCHLCQLDKKLTSSTLSNITFLMLRFDELALGMQISPSGVKKELEAMIQEINRIYDREGRDTLKVALYQMYKRYAISCMHAGSLSEVMNAIDHALRSIGLSVGDLLEKTRKGDNTIFPPDSGTFKRYSITSLAVLLVQAYSMSGRRTEAKKWLKVLIQLERVCCLGNVDTIRAKFGHAIDDDIFAAMV